MEYQFDSHFINRYKVDENEKKLLDFFSSKFVAMEKIILEDDYFVEEEIKTKKVKTDKNLFPISEHSKSRKSCDFANKRKTKKKHSRKKFHNRNNNENIIVNANGKIGKPKIENFDLVDIINYDVEAETKKKKFSQFFSNKTILTSILNEMKD